MEEILEDYYQNNAKKLHHLVDKILWKFGGIAHKDRDDFYSLANEVFVSTMQRYDGSIPFDAFLNACLIHKIKSEITARNRLKRKAGQQIVSLDIPIGEEDSTIGDMLPSDFDLEEIVEQRGEVLSTVKQYLSRLSDIQRQILIMKMEEIPVETIKKTLELTDRQYENNMSRIKSFGSTRVLFQREMNHIRVGKEECNMSGLLLQTTEKSKQKSYSVHSIIKKIDNYTIRFDHPTQRESDQWSPKMKGNLISDMLQGNPIPALVFAEQIVDGMVIIWDLDGKQRCTNAYSFAKNEFRISRTVRRWLIEYQGRIQDIGGHPQFERKVCDIRGKRYSDLPEELQDKFNDYTFEVTQYLNCSSEDIVYHMSRYNEGKTMTPSQKGLAYLGEEYALLVKEIAQMDFFQNQGAYKAAEFRNGTVNRVVVESIMAGEFLTDWKKQQEEMCDFIRLHATLAHFQRFRELVGRLEKVMTAELSEMFQARDSFLWFGLFSRFVKNGLPEQQFIAFL